jgi:poly(hydroxyalkanoate) depolymerase family esterase
MWPTLKRWLSSFVSVARRLALRLTGRPLGRWVEGSHAEPNRRLLFLPLPQAKRHYHLYLPGRYAATKSWPLLVMLHGCKQDPVTFSSGTRMNQLADQQGFLVLYPEQRRWANAYRCWNWFDSSAQRAGGEAALIAGMVRDVTATYGVDPGRVYIAGLSAGGAMASIMASCYGDLFAACAVHSGLMYRAAESVSDATKAMKQGSRASPENTARQAITHKDFAFVPAIVIHGSKDDTVNPVNAEQVVEQFIAMSSLADGANTALTDVTRSESGGDRYPYETRDYRRGDMLLLRKVLVEGLDHSWSGGDGAHAFNDPKGPDASRMIWEFFAGFQRSKQKAPAVVVSGRTNHA